MKSYNKKDLYMGMMVTIMLPQYRILTEGKILSFTPKKVRVEYTWQGRTHDTIIWPEQIIVLEGT